MILYLHRPDYLDHWVGLGNAESIDSNLSSGKCVQVSDTGTKLDANPSGFGWHWIYAMDLETGEYIGSAEADDIKPAPWVHDPLLRALKVAEFLEKEKK